MSFRKMQMMKTERLCLKPISNSDMDDMIALFINDEIKKTYMLPDFASDNEKIQLFKKLKERAESTEHFVYGIYLRNRLIGYIHDVAVGEKEVEVGYVIHPDHKNNGYATEGLKAVMQEMFDSGYLIVKAGAFEENIASMRVMEKCGMVRMEEKETIEYRGALHQCIYYQKMCCLM